MTNRREVFGFLGAALAAAAQQKNVQQQKNTVQVIHHQPLPKPFEGWEAEFVKVTAVPGPGSPPHQHKGFVLGYVLNGEFRFAIDEEPVRVLKAGETFYEPPGAHHRVSASASETQSAQVLAILIRPIEDKA